MAPEEVYLFVSYAREDLDRISTLLDAVRDELEFRLPIKLWVDKTNLRPGEQWDVAITEALHASIGFLFFVSPRSLRSDWIHRELSAAVTSGRLIIPVLLRRPSDLPDLPLALAERQWLDFSGPHQTRKQIAEIAIKIVDAAEGYLKTTPRPRPPVSQVEAPFVAADIANEVRAANTPGTAAGDEPNSVFVVHGHNAEALAKLEEYLSALGIAAVVLSRLDESPQSLFQKFMSVAKQARFAIVLLGADDYGVSREQYEALNVADKALQFRARQNVILELGFFYGRLGWENVFVLHQPPEKVFPNFELPSDLHGVVFDSIRSKDWQKSLGGKLSKAGFKIRLQ